MARSDEEDNVFSAPPRKKIVHEIGENLDMLSAGELRERVELLQAEIVRLETAAAAKDASKNAADAFFKKS
ncbi:MAG: DUF1192 domain-containing protein [Rhizobiales bacterium]|nr:DUF1192 domain-containing protein [Hyphomicrobiales bacterium]